MVSLDMLHQEFTVAIDDVAYLASIMRPWTPVMILLPVVKEVLFPLKLSSTRAAFVNAGSDRHGEVDSNSLVRWCSFGDLGSLKVEDSP